MNKIKCILFSIWIVTLCTNQIAGKAKISTIHPRFGGMIAISRAGIVYEAMGSSPNRLSAWRIVARSHYKYDANNGIFTLVAGHYLWCVDQFVQSIEWWNLETGEHRWSILKEFHTKEGIDEVADAWGLSNGSMVLAISHGVLLIRPDAAFHRFWMSYNRIYLPVKEIKLRRKQSPVRTWGEFGWDPPTATFDLAIALVTKNSIWFTSLNYLDHNVRILVTDLNLKPRYFWFVPRSLLISAFRGDDSSAYFLYYGVKGARRTAQLDQKRLYIARVDIDNGNAVLYKAHQEGEFNPHPYLSLSYPLTGWLKTGNDTFRAVLNNNDKSKKRISNMVCIHPGRGIFVSRNVTGLGMEGLIGLYQGEPLCIIKRGSRMAIAGLNTRTGKTNIYGYAPSNARRFLWLDDKSVSIPASMDEFCNSAGPSCSINN